MKKIFIYLSIGLSIINGSSIVTFSSYELSLDTLNGNYIRINKHNKLDSLNISISYDSSSIKLGLPMIESSNNHFADFLFNQGSLTIKSNPKYQKEITQDEENSILIPLSIINNQESFFLSFKDYLFSGINDKVIELRVSNGKIFIKNNIPLNFQLKNNFPDPLRRNFVIRFELPSPSMIDLIIYDIKGNRVRILELENNFQAGFYNKIWDGKNDMGAKVSEGAYVCSIKVNNNYHYMKMLLLR